ncbi:hypothetical protein T492DRAFT_1145153 [Pavlovales sp. CCMP2436]|nr:hypothetical protein T492DRAFT_1145153 [Pavlovales sp. CCMP2436]
MIEDDVIHDFIAGLATSGLDGGGVAADPESAARFQRDGLAKYAHAMAVAGLSKRQRIDIDQAMRIVDARPRCPCCKQTAEEDRHLSMRTSLRLSPSPRCAAQRHTMRRHAGELRLTTSTKFKLHLNKVARIFEIQRK